MSFERDESTRNNIKSELIIPLTYKGLELDSLIRCDFLVEELIVVETKAIESLISIHDAQVLSYMQQLKVPKGILYNFHCDNLLRKGQKTLVNKLFGQLQDY